MHIRGGGRGDRIKATRSEGGGAGQGFFGGANLGFPKTEENEIEDPSIRSGDPQDVAIPKDRAFDVSPAKPLDCEKSYHAGAETLLTGRVKKTERGNKRVMLGL